MIGLKTTLVTFLMGALLSGGIAWQYQENKYKALMAKDVSVRTAELAKVTETVIKQERVNSELTQKLESNSLVAQQRIAELLAANRRAVATSGLYLPGSCKAPAGTSTAAPGKLITETTVCRLSDEVAEQLLTEAARADSAAEYAGVCYDFTQQINRQRERMIMEQTHE